MGRHIIGLLLLAAKFLLFVLPVHLIRGWRQRTAAKRGATLKPGESAKARAVSAKDGGAPAPVLLLSFVEWTGAWQRPHHLAVGLAKDRPVTFAYWHRVHHWPRGKSILRVLRSELKRRKDSQLSVLSVPAFPLDARLPLVRAMNNLLLQHALRRHFPWRRPLRVIANAPWFAPTLRALAPSFLLYDVMDELASDRSARRAEQWLLQEADRVTAGTWALTQKKGQMRGDVEFINCGVEFDHFHRATEPAKPGSKTYEVRRSLDLGRRPVAGFFGAINDRLDAALLKYLAGAATDFDFLMIGPRYPSAPRPPSLENWKFAGKVDYRDLPDYVRLFDIALIPYHTRGMNRFLHPVKVMEYMAAGKPVVSTPLPDVAEFYGDFIQIAETPEEFLRAMRAAVKEPGRFRDRVSAGMNYAHERSWEEFIEAFRRMLDSK